MLNAYCKVYPTPPPSRRPIRVKQARLAAENAAKDAGQQEGDSGHGMDKSGRHNLGVRFQASVVVPRLGCLPSRLTIMSVMYLQAARQYMDSSEDLMCHPCSWLIHAWPACMPVKQDKCVGSECTNCSWMSVLIVFGCMSCASRVSNTSACFLL